MPTVEELAARLSALEAVSAASMSLRADVADIDRQLQRLQGGSGALEPLSLISAYDEVSPTTTPASGTYVGQGQLLLAGQGIIIEKPVNTPYLRIKASGGGNMNSDYVVDASGNGTHLSLYGASGALQAAITAGTSKAIWLCSTHSETVSSQQIYTGMASGQTIIVRSMGYDRAVIHKGFAGSSLMGWSSACLSNSHLIFQDMNFTLDAVASNTDAFMTATANGANYPDIVEFDHVGFTSSAGASFYFGFLINTVGHTTHSGDLIVRSCNGNAIHSVVQSDSGNTAQGSLIVEDNVFTAIDTIAVRQSTAVGSDFGGSGAGQYIAVRNNKLQLTSYIIKRTNGAIPLVIENNYIYQTSANVLVDAGNGTATGSPKDVTIVGNHIFCTVAGGTVFTMSASSGTASNINISANDLAGPGSGTAITLNVAAESTTDGYFVNNSYRDWATNVGGTAAASASGVLHSSLLSLVSPADDHTQYAYLTGRAGGQTLIGGTATGNNLTLRSNSFATPGDGSILLEDANFGINITSSNPRIFFDTSSDRLVYDRANNRLLTLIGNTEVTRVASAASFVAGYLKVSSDNTTAPNNTTAGDATVTRLSVGNSAVFGSAGNAGSIVDVAGTLTNTAGGAISFMAATPTYAPASASSTEFRTLYFLGITSDSGGTFNLMEGVYAELRHRSTQTIATSTGMIPVALVVDSASPATVGTTTTARSMEPRLLNNPSGNITATITTGIGIDFTTNFLTTQAGSTLTVTDAYMIRMQNQTVGGAMTVTTLYGLDIAKFTKGATNIEFRNAGKTVWTPTTQAIGAAGDVLVNTGTELDVTVAAGGITLTSAANIATAGAQDGQLLLLTNVDTADTLTLTNGNGVRLPGAANLALGPRDSAWFKYVLALTEWWCVGTTNL